MKKIVLGGLEGRMGSFLVEALKEEEDICLVAGISEKENFEGEVPIYSDINQVVNEVNFDIYVDFHKADDGTVIYYVYLDNAQIAMYDVEVIAVENMNPYQETDMMPTKGIFEDQKFSMIPYQYNVTAGYVKGFAISGDVNAEQVQLNVMVTWKDSTRLNVSREFFEFNNLDAGAMGSHEGNDVQIGEIIDAEEE